MRALLQRVAWAKVHVDGEVVGAIDGGLLVFLGCEKGDGPMESVQMAHRILTYRVFQDEQGKTNLDLMSVQGALLLISQFTLAAQTDKGRRPSFDTALEPGAAQKRVQEVERELAMAGFPPETGRFGASMQVESLNDGPANYLLQVKSNNSDLTDSHKS